MDGFDIQHIAVDTQNLIYDLGYDVGQADLIQTPMRVAEMWHEFLNVGLPNLTDFESNGYDEIILQRGIKFYSFCRHHLLPFFGQAAVGYVVGPSKRILGISKLARVVDYFSRRLQTQEYMTYQIGTYFQTELEPLGVIVVVEARHLCEEMRGIKQGAETVTSFTSGCFRDNASARAEAMILIKGDK